MLILSLLDVFKYEKILDVACGPGYGVKLTISQMNNNSILYSADISQEMLKYADEMLLNYDDFIKNDQNDYAFIKPSDRISIDKDIGEIREKKHGKIVRLLKDNAECLSYEDNQFDAYIASMMLMLVDDWKKCIKEAYRVLKSGGSAGFSIWGPKDRSKYFSLFYDNLEKYGFNKENFNDYPYRFSEKLDEIKQLMISLGFRNLKIEKCMNIIRVDNKEDFRPMFSLGVLNKLKDEDKNKVDNFLKHMDEVVEKEVIHGEGYPSFEAWIIIGSK